MDLNEFFDEGLPLRGLFPESWDYLPGPLSHLFNLHQSAHAWAILGAPLKQAIAQCISEVQPQERIQGEVDPRAWLIGTEIVIEKGATVEAGAYIEGPAFIAKGAVIRHGAYIRGYVYVGPGGIIGHTTEAKETILLKEAKAAHFAYLGNSILGAFVNLGAGTKLANLRIDHGHIKIKTPTQTLHTQLKKFGALLGDHAQTGCNSVTNPGTILLPKSIIMPCQTATGIVAVRQK